MRTMYDAVTASNIPRTAGMVAGYIDKIKLEPWSAADWARFPDAVTVTIVKKASTNAGDVLDVEPGDATPAEAPGWVRMRRAAGADPTVYMNASTWPMVRQEFVRQNVAPPHYWVAKYDGSPTWAAGWADLGCVAKQYLGDVAPGIDVSSVADFWPGVDSTTPAPVPGTDDGEDLHMIRKDCKAIPDNGFVSLELAGTDKASVTVYPGRAIDPADGKLKAWPVWVGDVFWWGEGHKPGDSSTGGLGNNPSPGPDAIRVDGITTFTCAKALLAEIAFSSNADFFVVGKG
jgi:hypothetical protein